MGVLYYKIFLRKLKNKQTVKHHTHRNLKERGTLSGAETYHWGDGSMSGERNPK